MFEQSNQSGRRSCLAMLAISSFSISYWLLLRSFDGSLEFGVTFWVGITFLIPALILLFRIGELPSMLEQGALISIASSLSSVFVWFCLSGMHPYIREIPFVQIAFVCVILTIRGSSLSDSRRLTAARFLIEGSVGALLGLSVGRIFEGHHRLIMTITLLACILTWVWVWRSMQLHGHSRMNNMNRSSFFLLSVSLGLIMFKYDIESHLPWKPAVWTLHFGTQKYFPVVLSWLMSASVVLFLLNRLPTVEHIEDE